mgnify:CR=1 FL=1
MVRYYGFYSNVARGKRKKAAVDDQIPSIIEPELGTGALRRNWARLIQKVYEVDPLLCPKCAAQMKIIAFIEDEDVIRKILKHLGLWDAKRKPPPRANAPPCDGISIYDEPSAPSVDDCIIDPQYPVEVYF